MVIGAVTALLCPVPFHCRPPLLLVSYQRKEGREREGNRGRMAWWRADQWRCRRAHVRGRVTTWKQLSKAGKRRGPVSLFSPSHKPVTVPCHTSRPHTTRSILTPGVGGRGGRELGARTTATGACLPAVLPPPHSIPHARALNTCPGGARPELPATSQQQKKTFTTFFRPNCTTVQCLYHVRVFCLLRSTTP